MELEQLKNAWASVDERLKKQEILNETIIRELIQKKAKKSLNVLQWTEFIGIPVYLAIIPFAVWAYEKFGGLYHTWDVLLLYSLAFCIAMVPFLLYKAFFLFKIDLTDNYKNNLFYINKFGIAVKREKIVMCITGVLFSILLIPAIIELKVGSSKLVVMICLYLFGVLYSIWYYKKLYDKNIHSIRRDLEELKELEE